jgi:glycine cleavage system H protein
MMATYPRDLQYTREHEWARLEGEVIRVGITAYAVEQLGDVTLVDMPAPGEDVQAHDEGPYEDGWLITIRPSDQGELDGLMDAAKYEEYLGTLDG